MAHIVTTDPDTLLELLHEVIRQSGDNLGALLEDLAAGPNAEQRWLALNASFVQGQAQTREALAAVNALDVVVHSGAPLESLIGFADTTIDVVAATLSLECTLFDQVTLSAQL